MKKLLLTMTLVMAVTACDYMPPTYDNNEYLIFARLETHARFLHDECDDPTKVIARLEKMHYDAELLNTYSFYLPRHSEIFEISKILSEDVREMNARYEGEKPPSVTYCTLKSQVFSGKAREAIKAIGNLQEE